ILQYLGDRLVLPSMIALKFRPFVRVQSMASNVCLESRLKTLLTGFGPFAGVAENPSADLAAYFARSGAAGHDLATRVFPVSFSRAESELRDLLCEGTYDLALLMGVAQDQSHIRLERFGRNLDDARTPDVDGSAPVSVSIRLGGPPSYQTAVSLDPF